MIDIETMRAALRNAVATHRKHQAIFAGTEYEAIFRAGEEFCQNALALSDHDLAAARLVIASAMDCIAESLQAVTNLMGRADDGQRTN